MIGVNYETRKHHRHVEHTQEAVIEGLSTNVVKERLGDYAIQLTSLAEDIQVPNIRNGVVKLPKNFLNHTDVVPTISVNQGDSLKIPAELAALTPRQFIELLNIFASFTDSPDNILPQYSVVDAVNEALKVNAAKDVHLDRALGTISMTGVRVDLVPNAFTLRASSSGKLVTGRPLLILSLPDRDQNKELSESVLVHELVHVNQYYCNPIRPYEPLELLESRQRDELEAYHVSSEYARASSFDIFGDADLYSTDLIDTLRRLYVSPEDRFHPNANILKRLRAHSIDLVNLKKTC